MAKKNIEKDTVTLHAEEQLKESGNVNLNASIALQKAEARRRTLLKTYKEEEIKTYIDRYSKVIGDKDYFWHYKWTLKDFLNRKDGISAFTDEGSKWVNYYEQSKKREAKNVNMGNNSGSEIKGVIVF